MKANEAPERIYCESDGISNIVKVHNIKWPDDEAENIEYTRTDAFIEKACEWLQNSTYGYLTEKWGEIDLDREELAVDFANYMKGE